MGKSSKTTVGHWYSLGVQALIGWGPLDRITRLEVDGKQAWAGSGRGGAVVVDAENIHGGPKNGGGVSGWFDVCMGEADQGANAYLSRFLPAPLSAWRGLTTLVFKGFVWGTDPYIGDLKVDVQRVMTGHDGEEIWRSDLAAIPGDFECHDTALCLALGIATNATPSIADDIRAGAARLLREIAAQDDDERPNSVRIVTGSGNAALAKEIRDCTAEDYETLALWVEGLANAPGNLNNWHVITESLADFFNGGAGLHPYSGAEFAPFGQAGRLRFEPAAPPSRHRRRLLVAISSGEPYQYGEDAAGARVAEVGQLDAYVVNISGSGTGGQLVSSVHNMPDYPSVKGVAGDADAIWDAVSAPFRALEMNAVHIMREAMISNAFGRAEPAATFHATDWDACAAALKAEGFGLSVYWERKEDVDSFIRDIAATVDAKIYTDPRTGLWRCKLIRDDYDAADLLVIDDDDVASWEGVSRRSPSEVYTAVTVTFSDRTTRKTGSRTYTNTAARAALGYDNVATRAFPYITRGDLAARVAEREELGLGSTLLAGVITVSRVAADLQEGDVFVLHSPRRGIDSVVCRVDEVSAGDATDHSFRITFAEDKFAIPGASSVAGTISRPSPSGLSTAARAAPARMVEEAPWRILARAMGDADADAALADDPEAASLALAALSPGGAALWADPMVDAGAGYEEGTSFAFCPGGRLLESVSSSPDATVLRIPADVALRQVETGAAAWLDGEFVRVDAVEAATSAALGDHAAITVGRGCMDTIPAAHGVGAYLLFFDGLLSDQGVAFTGGEAADVRILTRTATAQLAASAAPVDHVAFDARAVRPYPVGNLQLAGAWAPTDVLVASSALTWAHRDRTLQTGTDLHDFIDGNIGPEDGVSYRVEERAVFPRANVFAPADAFAGADVFAGGAAGDMIRSEDVGAVTSWDWDPGFAPDLFDAPDVFATDEFFGAAPPSALYAELRVIAERDGFDSWTVPAIRARRLLAPADLGFAAIDGGVRLGWRSREPAAEAQRVYQSTTKFNAAALPAPAAVLAAGVEEWDAPGLGWFAVGAVKGAAVALSEILYAGDLSVPTGAAVPVFSAEKTDTGSNAAGVVTGYDRIFHAGDGAFDATTGVWTVAASGLYLLAAGAFPYSGTPAGTTIRAIIQKNGATLFGSRFYRASGYGAGAQGVTGGLAELSAGDQIRLYSQGDGANDARLSAIQLTGLVAVSAVKATASGSVDATIANYDSAVGSTESFNLASGIFTAPKSGLYHVKAQGYPSGGISGVGLYTRIQVNGVDVPDLVSQVYWAGTFGDTVGTPILLPLTVGDAVSLRQTEKARQDVVFTIVEVPAADVAFSAKIASAGTPQTNWTLLAQQGEAFDPVSGVFTAPEDGVYLIAHTATGVANAGNVGGPFEVQARILIDGGDAIRGRYYAYGQIFRGQPAAEVLVDLTAGQEVTFTGINSSAASAFVFGWRIA